MLEQLEKYIAEYWRNTPNIDGKHIKKYLEQAVAQKTSNSSFYIALSTLYFKFDEPEKAVNLLEQSYNICQDRLDDWWNNYYNILMTLQQYGRLLHTLNSKYRNDANSTHILRYMIFTYAHYGDLDQAIYFANKLFLLDNNAVDEKLWNKLMIIAIEWGGHLFDKDLLALLTNKNNQLRRYSDIDNHDLKHIFSLLYISTDETIQAFLNHCKPHSLKHISQQKSDDAHEDMCIFIHPSHHAFGDTIMYSLYLPAYIKAHVKARIILLCHPPLVKLYQILFGDMANVAIINSAHMPAHLAPFLSAKYLYYTKFSDLVYWGYQQHTISNFKNFSALANLKKPALSNDKPHIAVIWKSETQKYVSTRRDMPLEHLWHLRPFKDKVQFMVITHQLDKHERDDVVDMLDAIDVSDNIQDFADAASYLKACDLVISIDSAYLHLSAAIGVDTWLLDRWDTEWRWPKDPTDACHWYENLRIFRQPIPRAWNYVIQDVKAALKERFA